MDVSKAKHEDTATTLQADIKEQKKEIYKTYGWYFLAKDIADFCNTTYLDILNTSALEVLGLIMVIQAKTEYNKLNG